MQGTYSVEENQPSPQSQAIDFTTDPAPGYIEELKKASLIPDFVDLEKIPSPEDLVNLPNVAFAEPSTRSFPVHTKTASWLSGVSAFVYGHTPENTPWINRLKTACAAHQVTEDVRKAHDYIINKSKQAKNNNELNSNKVKEASNNNKPDYENDFAIGIKVEPNSPRQYFYPLRNEYEIEDSALKIAQDMREEKLPEAWFAEACQNLTKAASAKNVSISRIPSVVRKMGISALPDREVIDRHLEMRKEDGLNEEQIDFYKKAAEGAMRGDFEPMESALIWQSADKKFGLNKYKGDLSPVWAMRSGHSEEFINQAKNASVLISDEIVPHGAFVTLSDEVVTLNLPVKDAKTTLQAKQASNGVEASKQLASISSESQIELLRLIYHNAS